MKKDYETIIASIEAQFDNIITIGDELAATKDLDVRSEKISIISFLVMKLLNTMNVAFDPPKSPADFEGELDKVEWTELRKLWRGDGALTAKEIIRQWREIPPTLLEVAIPVAVLRDLIGLHKIIFDYNKEFKVKGVGVHPWRVFADRYMALILTS